jgi:hypothetical protein
VLRAYQAIQTVLAARLGRDRWEVFLPTWNDEPGRTLDEVIDLAEAARDCLARTDALRQAQRSRSLMLPSEVARGALEYLETHGWSRGTTDERRCLMDALVRSGGEPATWQAVAEAMVPVTGTLAVIRWNDAWGRTEDEIHAALKHAIVTLEAQGQ